MEAEIDPRFGLADEVFGAAGGGEDLGTRRFHREVDVPAAVVDLVNAPHAAFAEQAGHLVEIEDDVAELPLGGDGAFGLEARPGTRLELGPI